MFSLIHLFSGTDRQLFAVFLLKMIELITELEKVAIGLGLSLIAFDDADHFLCHVPCGRDREFLDGCIAAFEADRRRDGPCLCFY